MSRFRQIGGWIWYPWLAALFPIIFLYSHNFGKVYGDEFLAACGAALVVVGLLVGLLWVIVRDVHKAGAMAATVVVLFSTYGPLHNTLAAVPRLVKQLPVPLVVIVIGLGAAGVIALGLWASAKSLRRAAPTLNLLTAVLVTFNLAILAHGEVQAANALRTQDIAQAAERPTQKIANDAQHPDVYYIILDAYPSSDFLRRRNKFDNSAFIDGLEKRGFYVADDSTSNYPLTLPSKASSLNMR